MIHGSLRDVAALFNVVTDSDASFTSISIDSRNISSGALFVAITGAQFDGHDFVAAAKQAGAVALLVERPVTTDLPCLQVKNTRLALGTLAKWHRQKFSIPVIGLTGSCGKTTTKAMLASILQIRGNTLATQGTLNNDIGVPLTLFNLGPEHQFAVIEMGTNHPGEIPYLADIAEPTHGVITNIAMVHIENFGSVDAIAAEKSAVYRALVKEESVAIVNHDDAQFPYWQKTLATKKVKTFGLLADADVRASDIILREDGGADFILHYQNQQTPIYLPILGVHNVMNALAAAATAFSLGLTHAEVQQGLKQTPAVEKRSIRYVGWQGVEIIDDSYNANPVAFKAAIDLLKNLAGNHRRYLVMGDMAELGEDALKWHAEVGKMAKSAGLQGLFTVGKFSQAATEAFGEGAQHFADQADLIEVLKKQAAPDVRFLVKGSKSSKMGNIVQALLK